jgi:DNA replication protein DnaC
VLPGGRSVAVFRHSAESLVQLVSESVPERVLSDVIAENLRASQGINPGKGERRSWDRSIPILARDLVEAGLGGVEMLIEYQLPLTSKRADVILAGRDRRTGADSYLIVELKQWSHAELYEDDAELVLVPGMGERPKLHPVVQVRGYCEYLADFVGALDQHRNAVRGVAYLHNANDLDNHDLYDHVEDERTRLFSKTRRGQFVDYLKAQFAPEPGAAAADRLLSSSIRPSKQLLKAAAGEIKNRDQFVLLAEQRLAFEMVMHAVEKARASNSKQVVIITGGPGSGKSVIALSLLGEVSERGYTVLHATGSRSFTETMRKVVAKGSSRLKSMFKYFNNFMTATPNDLDVLICDEAHRIRETSENRFTKAAQRTGRPQVDELISAARVPVFLLDEHQVVRPPTRSTLNGSDRLAGLAAAAGFLTCVVLGVWSSVWSDGGALEELRGATESTHQMSPAGKPVVSIAPSPALTISASASTEPSPRPAAVKIAKRTRAESSGAVRPLRHHVGSVRTAYATLRIREPGENDREQGRASPRGRLWPP